MNEDGPLFILAGNGPYENRGCEAIVRGTVKILREHFKDPRFISISHFKSEEQYREQCLTETDRAIVHLASYRLNKKTIVQTAWKPKTWKAICHYLLNRDGYYASVYDDMLPHIPGADAILSVGGDNYSLDYGIPNLFTALDNLIISFNKPIIIWGASVGPFSAMPDYELYMSKHLQNVTGIFARESATIKYLEEIGVTRNVHSVADPAFLMDPVKPVGIEEEMPIEDGAIGLNLSPLMARYVTGGNLEEWMRGAMQIISEVAKTSKMPVYLIPHVTSPHSDDYAFMQKAVSRLQEKNHNITLIPPQYNAAETKWIISRMAIFAGARTHSTIAALSSCVPTLSFTYSIKAQGINQDIFGHNDYCMDPRDLEAEKVADQITSMLDQEILIRTELRERIPKVQKSALDAGLGLKQLIGEN